MKIIIGIRIMRRKLAIVFAAALLLGQSAEAQKNESFYGIGNRVGIGVGAGTEGIGFDAAVSLTKYLSLRAGVNIVPDIKINTDVDIEGLDATISYGGFQTTVSQVYQQKFGHGMSETIEAQGSLKRTTFDVKLDFYPFPESSSFFITGGLSFGGEQVVKATGYSEAMKDFATLKTSDPQLWSAVQNAVGINIDEQLIGFDDNGNVEATAKVSKCRPYLGLGFGRLIPKGRVGFRFELGAQFQGRPKIYDAYGEDVVNGDKYGLSDENKNDITKVLDYMKVYPVIKLSLRGRIL